MIVTLFYLSKQIRSNTTQARRADRDETMRHASASRMALALNSELADIVIRGSETVDCLSPVERLQFESFINDRYWTAAQLWDRARSGSLGARGWQPSFLPPLLLTKGALQCWDASKVQFTPDFVAEVEAIRSARSDA